MRMIKEGKNTKFQRPNMGMQEFKTIARLHENQKKLSVLVSADTGVEVRVTRHDQSDG